MRDEVWDTGDRKQESVTGYRPLRAASDPHYSLALTNSNLFLHPKMGFDGSENSEACWILPPFCLPPLNEEIRVLLTVTVTLAICMLEIKSQMV